MDWKQRITDIKTTGMFARTCDKCGFRADPVVRVTFEDSGDKYICVECTKGLVKGRKFNVFNSEF